MYHLTIVLIVEVEINIYKTLTSVLSSEGREGLAVTPRGWTRREVGGLAALKSLVIKENNCEVA